MNMPDGTHLAYTVYAETEWWQRLPRGLRPNEGRPCVQVAASAKGRGGGARWEFGVIEYEISRRAALRLEMFDECWEAFVRMPEFFAGLADVDTLDGVRELLDSLGAVDETERPAVGR